MQSVHVELSLIRRVVVIWHSRAVHQASLLPDHSFEISKHDVTSVFKNLKTNKASGPDKIRGKLLKVCYVQLSTVFQVLFQLCVELNEVPENGRNYTCSQKAKPYISERLQTYCSHIPADEIV